MTRENIARMVLGMAILNVVIASIRSTLDHWMATTPGGNWVSGMLFVATAMGSWWIAVHYIRKEGDEQDED